MSIRRKERPLTLEEIKEKTRDHTKENWMHGEPLLGFTPLLENGKLIALAPKAETDLLVLFFLDPADYVTDRALERIVQWQDTYKKLPWLPILVLRDDYIFLKNPRFFERFRSMPTFASQPVFIDSHQEWFKLHQVSEPTLLILRAGEVLLKASILNDFAEQFFAAELKIQDNLRVQDPGLPLAYAEKQELELAIDHEKRSPTQINPSGYWSPAENGLASDDPNAKISFSFSGTHIRLVAVTHPQARENTKLQVFLDDTPIPHALYGAQVHPGDRGQAVLEINKFSGMYELLRSDRKISGTITLKFLNTLENPVILYGLRIA